MHRGAALFEGGKRVSKPDHQAAFERPEHYAASVLRCNQGGRGHDVQIAESPRFLLNLLDRVMLRLALDIANVEVPVVNIPFEHSAPAYLYTGCALSRPAASRSQPHTKRRTIIPANRPRNPTNAVGGSFMLGLNKSTNARRSRIPPTQLVDRSYSA